MNDKAPHKQSDQVEGPPKPREIDRKLQIRPLQLIGVPLIMLIPILALFGVFGMTSDTTIVTAGDLVMSVEYPTRTRYQSGNKLTITLSSVADAPVESLAVLISREYLGGFTDVHVNPSNFAITGTDYVIPLGRLDPNEARVITVDVHPNTEGYHEGDIVIQADGEAVLTVSLRTFVFP